nr:alpha/beta fold hydrolase [Motilibacter deserti]
MVPGYGGSPAGLQPLAARLRADARRVVVLDLPDGGRGDLREQADALDDAVGRLESEGASSVDVVGYSAGGVTARLWASGHDGEHRARRIVTLGSPHHGTTAAAEADAAVGGCGGACSQLAPGSRLLATLNEGDETPEGPQWLAVWTAADATVTPPESGRLDGAVNVRLQDVCPGQVSHGELPRDLAVVGLVLTALSAEPIGPPREGCAAYRARGRG